MATCRNSVMSISEMLKNIFKRSRSLGLPPVPPFLLMVGSKLRPGLSHQMISSRVIKRFGEIGAHSGPMADGSANVMEKLVSVMSEEIVNSIVLEAKIDAVIDPGAIQVVAMGGNAGGPVVCQGTNINPASAGGTVR